MGLHTQNGTLGSPIHTTIFSILVFLFASAGWAVTTNEALAQLKEIQTQNRTALEKTDRSIQEQLKKTTGIKAKDLATGDHDSSFRAIEESILQVQEKKRELLLRHDFLNQLINKFASNYKGQPLNSFFEQNLLEMAATELGVGSFEQPSQNEYWRFLIYLSVAVRELPEQIEDLFKFTQSYMEFSSISNPKSPGDFRAHRNYFNSKKGEAGKPSDADQVELPEDK